MQRISSEHPGYPVRVLSGDLVENPTTTGEMMRNHPTMREFFVRLAKTTGQAVGQDFLRRLEIGCSWPRPARKQAAARTEKGGKPAVK